MDDRISKNSENRLNAPERNQLVTVGDLAAFKINLLSDINSLLQQLHEANRSQRWLRSREVRKMLGIYLCKTHQATDRRTSMIDGVLAYSGINASSLKPGLVDRNKLLKNIEIDLKLIIQQREAEIVHDRLPKLEGAAVLLYQLSTTRSTIRSSLYLWNQKPLIEIWGDSVVVDGEKSGPHQPPG